MKPKKFFQIKSWVHEENYSVVVICTSILYTVGISINGQGLVRMEDPNSHNCLTNKSLLLMTRGTKTLRK